MCILKFLFSAAYSVGKAAARYLNVECMTSHALKYLYAEKLCKHAGIELLSVNIPLIVCCCSGISPLMRYVTLSSFLLSSPSLFNSLDRSVSQSVSQSVRRPLLLFLSSHVSISESASVFLSPKVKAGLGSLTNRQTTSSSLMFFTCIVHQARRDFFCFP